MSSWSLVLCEGPHDQEFLSTLLVIGDGWTAVDGLDVPGHKGGRTQAWETLTKDAATLAICSLGGVNHLLGEQGRNLVANFGDTATCIAVVVDADRVGPEGRERHLGEWWREAKRPEATRPRASQVVPGAPGSGLWCAPNCRDFGSLDELIVEAARRMNASRFELARSFIDSLAALDSHDWGAYRDKACAGALGQRWRAGGSLASALQARNEWMSPEIARAPPFEDLIGFLRRVARGA